jgi:hypothetical protein
MKRTVEFGSAWTDNKGREHYANEPFYSPQSGKSGRWQKSPISGNWIVVDTGEDFSSLAEAWAPEPAPEDEVVGTTQNGDKRYANDPPPRWEPERGSEHIRPGSQ